MKENLKYLILIIIVGIVAWYQTLGFWFFKAYEATWLMGLTPHNFVNLLRGHAFIYYIDWKIFGWNPWGWYLTGLLLHIFATLLLFKLVLLISKKVTLSFISSLLFVASTAYNDVLTWGSFNSYYPLLLIWMLLAMITFYKYKQTQKIYFLISSIIFSVFGFFTRETGIVIIPLLTIFDIVFSKDLKNKKTLIEIIKRQALFYLAIVAFFIIRSSYGGTPGDTADSNVKLQMRLVSDGLYLEYAKTALLTFGKLIPPQVIPYPALNFLREYASRFIYYELVNTYFFPVLGWLIFMGLGVIVYLLRKSKEYFRSFLFFWIWLGLFSIFVGLAIPNTPEVLARAYEYNTMRYRYFAFVGMSVLLASFLIILFRRPRFLFLIVSVAVIANLLLLWRIEQNVYAISYKPAKEFYIKFSSYFPTLPKESVFYIYPHASGLSDYLLEWFLIKDQSYPNLVAQPFRVESQIIAVLNKIKEGKTNINNTFFLDFDSREGLLNKTQEVRRLLTDQKEYQVNLNRNKNNVFESGVFEGPIVEIPYDLEIDLDVSWNDTFIGSSPDSSRFKTLVDYVVARNEYLNTVSLDTAYTMSQRAGEPFFHVLPKNLVDGNTGPRSSWIADTFDPWVQVDLGKEKEIIGVLWGSKEGSRVPATYSILVSKNQKKWEKVKMVKNSNKTKSIDVFEEPVVGRFVRMEIKTTSGGDFVLLDEFEVLTSSNKKILSYYSDRDELLNDIYNMFEFSAGLDDLNYAKEKGLNFHWARLSWETNKTSSLQNNQYLYFPYQISQGQKVSIKLPEGEVYAGNGQFLKKNITSISLDFGPLPLIIDVKSLNLVPRINLK